MTVSPLALAELGFNYQEEDSVRPWAAVLVDLPQNEGVYTYAIPPDLTVQDGDIVAVPFGNQQLGGIVVGCLTKLPPDLPPEKIKPIQDVIVSGFFAPHYWRLLHWLAEYYCTELITVIRMALPPGLLQRSQRRIKLNGDRLPSDWPLFLSQPSHQGARQILTLLQSSKEGDYSYRYLRQKVPGLTKALRDLLKRQWVESYLEPPKAVRPQLPKMVTLLNFDPGAKLTELQARSLTVLKNQGGEMWLADLLKAVPCSASTIQSLAKKGLVAIAEREKLRLFQQPSVNASQAPELTPAQQQACQTILPLQGYHQVLLHGVTGSGKTEVYLQICGDRLGKGQSVLVLVPEIGLTPQLTDRFRARFGNKVAVYHSGLSSGEKYDTWRQTLLGHEQIVIGTRSAIFTPLPNLGLIILDEEHDSSFKQTQLTPNYHARTVAQRRAELEQCPLILGSATPSLESWHTVHRHQNDPQRHYLELPERVQSRPLPPVQIVDMRAELKQGNRSIFSRALQTALGELKAKQQQGILFINRRGHSTFVSCRSCGYVLECPNCDVSLSYHYVQGGGQPLLRCHYCNYAETQPKVCPECSSPYLKFFGSGTQKVTEALTQEFPDLRWIRFDSDTTRRKGAHRQLLEQFKQGEADLLVGTQMLTKGLDLAQITLVGVVAADSLLNFADYRSAERGFQTLTQVSGRAGRGEEPGQVIIQTYTPHHPVIQAVKTHNYHGFIAQELPQREMLNYPPYGKLILLRCLGTNAKEVEKTIQAIAVLCEQLLPKTVEILGPAPASILRIAQRYRWQLLVKYPSSVKAILPLERIKQICPSSVYLDIDVDPLSID
ncbi:primosomal protein N' [Synechocystis sp. CACIAM 05]|uniref:primosomal protein N' n=1 Tax=Synechocystis sp. CACIAM 05 TaxID=1933929 RepID=UPI00138E7092|nr:primosomal protein N' [Synechocystis sp. CACIAM 05]QHV00373.1 primosomal protein N' [Synechocystis sp. CACIAM 05]